MSQYFTRIFCQILDSSIAEDFTLRRVIEDFLKVADWRTGIVDATRESLARKFNLPIKTLNDKIALLERSDPQSRDQHDEGRRLRRLDDHRNWGWQIVNWEKYADKKRQIDGAIRVAKHREEQASLQGLDDDTAMKIYEAYPKKVARKDAIRAIRNALKKEKPEVLLEKALAFAKLIKETDADMKYVPHPATWFNRESYNDDEKSVQSTYANKIPRKSNPRNIGIATDPIEQGKKHAAFVAKQQSERNAKYERDKVAAQVVAP